MKTVEKISGVEIGKSNAPIMKVVDRETATNDVNVWLNAKRVPNSKREQYASSIEALISGAMDGCLEFSETGIQQNLLWPIENKDGEVSRTFLEFRLRMNVKEYNKAVKGIKADDARGLMVAIAAELTSQPKNIIINLEDVDYSITQSILVFFV